MDRNANIYLVGMMGSGKTTIGKALARRLHRPFIDCDQEIVRRTGVSIPVIFDIEGERGFRQREGAALRELTTAHGIVLATGGGAVLHPDNRKLLRSSGIVIYLRASVDDLWQRTGHDRNRPLLQTHDPREAIAKLLVEREALYQEVADVIVETGDQGVSSLVRQLLDKLSSFSQPTV